jgi:hypothetical protein
VNENPKRSVRNRRPSATALWKISAIATLVCPATLVLTWNALQASSRVGRLSVPPTYDDVVYFAAAAKWLSEAHRQPVLSSVVSLLSQHAPYATLSAIAGLLMTRHSYIGAYAVNGVVIAAFLLGIALLVRRSRLFQIAAALLLAGCVPVVGQAVNEARPDLPWGLAFGLLSAVLVNTPLTLRSRRMAIILGALSGVVVLLKPAALPASIGAIASLLVISRVAGELTDEPRAPAHTNGGRYWLFAAAGAAIMAPYLTVSLKHAAHYIWNTMVVNGDQWQYHAPLSAHATYYSAGYGGHLALGNWLWIGLALFAVRAALALACAQSDLARTIRLFCALAVAYAIPTLSPMKSFFLGAIFYGTFVVAMALNAVAVLDILAAVSPGSLRRWLAPVAALGLMVVFIRTAIAGEVVLATRFDDRLRQDMTTYSPLVWSTLRAAASTVPADHAPLDIAFLSPYPVNSWLMQLYAERELVPVRTREAYYGRSVNATVANLSSADIAVISTATPANFNGFTENADVMRAFDQSASYCVLGSWTLGPSQQLRVFAKGNLLCEAVRDRPGLVRPD